MVVQQRVAVVVEVADERHVDAHAVQLLADVRDGLGRLLAVHRDADEFGAGAGQGGHLLRGALGIGRVGVGHGLDDDGGAAAHRDVAHLHGDRGPAVLDRGIAHG